MSKIALGFSLPALLALVACTGLDLQATDSKKGGSNTIIVNGNGQICAFYCGKLNSCDNKKDVDTCTNRCSNANAATLPKLREEIVGSMAECLQAKDCKTILDRDPVATCAAEAVAASAPSETATALCDSMQKAKDKCSDSYSKAACFSLAKLFNDGALSEAQKCVEKPCDAIDACFDAALGSISDGDSSTSTNNDPPSSPSNPSNPSTGSDGGTSSSSSSSSSSGGSSGPTPPAPTPPGMPAGW